MASISLGFNVLRFDMEHKELGVYLFMHRFDSLQVKKDVEVGYPIVWLTSILPLYIRGKGFSFYKPEKWITVRHCVHGHILYVVQ